MQSCVDTKQLKCFSPRKPTLGVVVPCHDNSRQLYGVLTSLQRQTVRPESVVVVNDNSNWWEVRRLKALCSTFGAHYRCLPVPQSLRERLGRRSHARNLGTKCLDTDIVLYLDGDILLGPRYVEEVKFYHGEMEKVYIRGPRHGIPMACQRLGMDACLNAIWKGVCFAGTSSLEYVTRPRSFRGKNVCQSAYYDKWEWVASNNLSVRYKDISQAGFWDENFFGWGEEDMDCSFRLFQLGLTPIFLNSDNATCYHLDHNINRDLNAVTLKENGRYLMSKFPGVAEYRKEAYALFDINIEEILSN